MIDDNALFGHIGPVEHCLN